MKMCVTCGLEKALSLFSPSAWCSQRVRPMCKECMTAYQRIHRQAKKYYPALFMRQGGVCKMCRRPEIIVSKKGKLRDLCIDIDYTYGYIRGLLCNECNIGLGKFKEDPARLRGAIDYLEESKANATQFRIAA